MILAGKPPKAIPYIFIALMAAIAFWPTLKIGFMWDDHEMIERNPAVQSVSAANIKRAFQGDVFDGKGDPYFRPLQTLFNMADHAVWGLHPFGYHLTNLLLHIGAALLLFVCFRRIFNDEWKPLLIALFFAVHPIIVEQLLIIAGRAELMAALFTFGAMALAFQKNNLAYALSVIGCFLACLSKESGAAMPLFLALAGWYNPDLRLPVKRYIGYAAAVLLYFYLRARAVGPAPLFPGTMALADFLVRDLPTIALTYLRVLIFPFDLHSHRRMAFQQMWMYLSPLLLTGTLAFCLFKKWRWGLFAIGWFLVGLAPKLPLLATNGLMLDHWAYICGPALFIAIVFLAPQLWAPWAFMAVWIGLGHWNIQLRNTDKKLYLHALKFPTSSTVRYNLGLIYYLEGNPAEALPLFRASLAMNPDSLPAMSLEALTVWKLGDSQEAIRLLTERITSHPDGLPLYVNRAVVQRGERGLADVEFVLSKKPDYGFALALREDLKREMAAAPVRR